MTVSPAVPFRRIGYIAFHARIAKNPITNRGSVHTPDNDSETVLICRHLVDLAAFLAEVEALLHAVQVVAAGLEPGDGDGADGGIGWRTMSLPSPPNRRAAIPAQLGGNERTTCPALARVCAISSRHGSAYGYSVERGA